MTIEKQRITCKCGHVFDAEMVTDCPVEVAVASMKTIRCPKCRNGYEKLSFGGELALKADASESIQERARDWISNGEVGTSSKTIWCAFTGAPDPKHGACYPYDPDDFRRCRRLLEIIPEWRAQLHVVVARFPWFKPFADRWEEFDALYEAEAKSGQAPKLYSAMQVARKEAEAIREQK